MPCTKCKSEKICIISGPDCINVTLVQEEHAFKNIVPISQLGLTNIEDDVAMLHFSYCLNCGQIQSGFPVCQTSIIETLSSQLDVFMTDEDNEDNEDFEDWNNELIDDEEEEII